MSITLYDFQKEDVQKLRKQKAALIGSEMGTGKTHCAIELDSLWAQDIKQETGRFHPTLVIAPLNTFDSWVEKYQEQMPEVDMFVIDRKNRDAFVKAIHHAKADVYLMHWDALRLVVAELKKYTFGTVIADEVHRIANRKAQATRALKQLQTHRKLAMSGTASGDKPWNLWSILNWLWPTYYRSYWRFVNHYAVQELVSRGNAAYRQFTGVQNAQSLHKEMSPWYVRHLKREQCCTHHPEGVMHWLPEKTYDTIWVDLTPQQRRVYDQMKKDMVAWVGEHEESPLVASVVVAQMTRLSQIALATPVVSSQTKTRYDRALEETIEQDYVAVELIAPSSKIDAVKELIKDHDDKQFVIFSSSKKACYLAQQEFAKASISSEVLSGDTPDSQRRGMVNRFVAKEFQIFIAVIQAAAEGIDGLQHATDTAIFLDRSWSTIKNKQAEDRLHRGGQKDTVTIIDVMARNTLDFGRKQKLDMKWSFIKMILGDNAQQQVMKEL
jgi:SNF2 family DNA or RNA helicase